MIHDQPKCLSFHNVRLVVIVVTEKIQPKQNRENRYYQRKIYHMHRNPLSNFLVWLLM